MSQLLTLLLALMLADVFIVGFEQINSGTIDVVQFAAIFSLILVAGPKITQHSLKIMNDR